MTDPVKLIHLYLEGRQTAEQADEFRTRLLEDGDFARLFARYGLLNSYIRNEFVEEDLQESLDRFAIPAPCPPGSTDDGSDTGQAVAESIMKSDEPDTEKLRQIKAQADKQLQAFLAEQEEVNRAQPSQAKPSFSFHEFYMGCAAKLDIFLKRLVALGLRTAICGVFVLVVMVGIHYWRTHRVVATLDDSSHAMWRIPPETLELRRGLMTLDQGYAKLSFKQGTQVLIQAPCTFELQSINKMALENGSMTANVPSQAVGFTVHTPWATVVDYGTEFGLSTGQTNGAELHVFKGKVGVGDGDASHVATEGQAALVDQAGHIGLKSIDDRPKLFMRDMPKPGSRFGIPGKRLDLADVVGGGNGFGTGDPGRALDPSPGYVSVSTRAAILPRGPLNNSGVRAGSGFIGIEQFPFIDGIFVPNGNDPSTLISSTGLVFQNCPSTHGTFYDGVVCGAAFDNQWVHPGRLAGHQYKTSERPSIGACANIGITFDLDSIRASMSDCMISRFKACCGISQSLADI